MPATEPVRLAGLDPRVTADDVVDQLVPPRQFRDATFASYRPDDEYPSQAEAVERLRSFAARGAGGRRGLFRRRSAAGKPGVYLDGGFGVGKTHLLAALYNATAGRRHYGTFIEYTALIGALGFATAVDRLAGAELVCIDEFELDDPGDTMLMSRLLAALVEKGTRIAATSNTPPAALGEGRFAAADFLREIQAMADRFDILRIDGVDFRRRSVDEEAVSLDGAELSSRVDARLADGAAVSLDDFDALVDHLATLHPSKYVRLVEGLDTVGLRDVTTLTDQSRALRFVAFVDRVYDAQLPVVASGTALSAVYGDEMLAGGYRKKYQRSISRLVASTRAAEGIPID